MQFNEYIKVRLLSRIITKYKNTGLRNQQIAKNIVISMVMKAAGFLSTLMVIPLTISYVNATTYGVWLTLYSFITWVYFFDMGLSQGFRNKFAEARAKNDNALAQQYVSSTYFIISCISIGVLVLFSIANFFIDWTSFLNIESSYSLELHKVFWIVITFVCLNMIFDIFSILVSANQEAWISSVIHAIGQFLSLGILFLLTRISKGSLINLALFFSGIPCISLAAISLWMFHFSKYKAFKPSISTIKIKLLHNIVSLGLRFFIIQLSMLFVFQIINVVITRELGALAVTQYNIADKYFSIIYMVSGIFLAPFWSAFTDAYTKKDFLWMIMITKRLQKFLIISVVCSIILLVCSPFVYKIWLGDSVYISISLSIAMFVSVICRTYGNMYMYLINGIGCIRLQLIIYLLFAVIAWPFYTFSARIFGLIGIVLLPSIVFFVQGLFGQLQINKIINNRAKGIWIE